MKYLIGLDIGTSNVKAVLFDTEGHEVHVKSREGHTISSNGNCVEQDMNAVWDNVQYCLKDLTKEAGVSKEDVAGIGVCGQGEGCWLIDKDGNPLQNAILWCDGRAVEEVNRVTKDNPEIGEYYYRTTGCQPLLGNQMVLLSWMKNNRKEILDKAEHLLFCKDWIRFKLTGKIGAELTDSTTSLVDVNTEKISDGLLDKMGVSAYRHLIPDPQRPDDIAGELKEELCEELGLPKGIPVIYGALDTSATAIGLGAIHNKDACVILGTTLAAEIVTKKEDCDFGAPNSRYERHPVGSLYVELQPTLNGTPNIDWMLENIADTKDFAEIDKIVESVPVASGGVVYLPYLSVAGERAPFYHPYARAEFFGISQNTTKKELIRAVYEGLSLSIRDCLQNVDRSKTLYLAGGGAKSPTWAQMIADVVGMKVMIPSGKELGARGVAIMTGVALGIYESYDAAVEKACSYTRSYEPNPIRAKKYSILYELYKDMRIANEGLWDYRHYMNKDINSIEE